MNDTTLGQARRALETVVAHMTEKGLIAGIVGDDMSKISVYVEYAGATKAPERLWVASLNIAEAHTHGFTLALDLRNARNRSYAQSSETKPVNLDAIERAIMAMVGETILEAKREADGYLLATRNASELEGMLATERLTVDGCRESDFVEELLVEKDGVHLAVSGVMPPALAALVLFAVLTYRAPAPVAAGESLLTSGCES